MLEVLLASCLALIALAGCFAVTTQVLHLQQHMQSDRPLLPCTADELFFHCDTYQLIIRNQQ